MDISKTKFSCIILAGGEGKRVDGRDKGLIHYQGKTLIQHVIDIVRQESDEIIISANRNIEEYKTYGYKVISDNNEQFRGPLAGIAASLPACQNDQVLIVPCDMPFLPDGLVETLSTGMKENGICIAESENHWQLVFLIDKSLLPSLQQSLRNNQLRLMQWLKSQQPIVHKFNNTHAFKNYNHSDELL
jgi:molybdopterin-guanine dinucleotide biosynthesis protein A